MVADLTSLYSCPLFRVLDFHCREEPHSVSTPEYAKNYSICFVRKGNFTYQINGKDYDIHTDTILLENAGTYHIAKHADVVRDECLIIQMSPDTLEEYRSLYWKDKIHNQKKFFQVHNTGFPVPVLKSHPWLDYLHLRGFNEANQRIRGTDTLHLETILAELVSRVFRVLYESSGSNYLNATPLRIKQYHLETVEKAKQFIATNFRRPISLGEISRNVALSEFHFARLFKQVTQESPYEYVLKVRLNYALLLLQSTFCSVFDACFESGFNSYSHFIASFTKQFGASPSKGRSMSIHKIKI